ncbi:MAG: molecular chaperone DnaK, partial [Cyanobacteria bacterium]|nr:molecular chaperone DnaK [Cyanobacteriota bacterium]
KQLADMGDKIPEADKTKLKQLVDDLRSAIHDGNHDKIKKLSEELQQATYAVSTKAYESASPEGGADASSNGHGGPDAKADEDIIDAEFRPSDEGVTAGK